MLIYYWYKTKDFNTFIYDHALHCGRKPFCHCLQAFRRKILKALKKYRDIKKLSEGMLQN